MEHNHVKGNFSSRHSFTTPPPPLYTVSIFFYEKANKQDHPLVQGSLSEILSAISLDLQIPQSQIKKAKKQQYVACAITKDVWNNES